MPSPLAVRSRRAVDDILARLRDRFGDFPVLDWTHVNDPAYFDHGVAFFENGGRGGAGARVTRDDGAVLLIRQPRRPEWVFPGGGHEPGESFPETARREVREEAGVECAVTGVWRAVRKRYVHEADPERRGYLLDVVFTAERTGGEAGCYPDRWDDDEDEVVSAVEWFHAPPEQVLPVVEDPTAPPDYPDE